MRINQSHRCFQDCAWAHNVTDQFYHVSHCVSMCFLLTLCIAVSHLHYQPLTSCQLKIEFI